MKVIILTRKPDVLIPCVESIFKNEPKLPHANIIIVKDGEPEERELAATPGCTWLKGVQPFIWSRNINQGMHCADDDDCVMMNDDTTLETFEGFTKLARAGQSFGITSAVIDGRCGPSQRPDRYPSNICQPVPGGRVASICWFIPKAVLKKVGDFDERFVNYGYDDDDYCIRVQQAEKPIVVYHGCLIKHYTDRMTFHGPGETNGISHWYNGDNHDIFIEKWGHR